MDYSGDNITEQQGHLESTGKPVASGPEIRIIILSSKTRDLNAFFRDYKRFQICKL